MNLFRTLLLCGLAAFLPARSLVAQTNALVEAGFPATSREWAGDDYTQIAGLLADGKTPLPRLADAEGQAFIRRLTSTDNLSLYRNRSLPIGERLVGFSSLMGGVNAVAKQYLAAVGRGLDVHRELTAEFAFILRAAAVGVDLMKEFLPTVPHDDHYAARMQGVAQFKSGLTTMFAGAEVSLSEKDFYSSEDRSLLLAAMAETLPAINKIFAPDYRVELRRKLEGHRAAFPDDQDARHLQAMIDTLGH